MVNDMLQVRDTLALAYYFICLFANLFICLFVYLFIFLLICLFAYLCIVHWVGAGTHSSRPADGTACAGGQVQTSGARKLRGRRMPAGRDYLGRCAVVLSTPPPLDPAFVASDLCRSVGATDVRQRSRTRIATISGHMLITELQLNCFAMFRSFFFI